MENGKRIGFVDYNLENFHANVYLAAMRNELKGRGYTVAGCTALNLVDGKAWAAKNGVPYFDSVGELDRTVDYYVVLAPSNPEVHLQLCQQVLPFGKTTYVDKTFAPDLAAAQRIFAIADQHQVAMQTSSALRYTNVQAYVKQVGLDAVLHMITWGGGRSFEEYAIHPVELAVSCLGTQAHRLMRRGTGHCSQLLIDCHGGRTAVVNVYTNADTPFAAAVTTAQGTQLITVDSSRLFIDMAAAILDLFDNGRPSIDRAESLLIRRILDVAQMPEALQGFVVL
ncbi:MAG: Gfo/Idh/MocA family oxidoreductase [Chloroflexi bacterium]|nr:Gfo/Idh/MocA family oxidoreductase [Chloroflexota bacterium]